MVYIGVDLHRKRSQLAAVNEEGELLFNRNVPSESLELLRVLGEVQDREPQVAFEATYGWGWFADLLADAGIPAHMAHPLATKAIAANRVKNDSVDAKTLAHLLRTGLLPEAWIAPPEVREARCLVRMRAGLVRIRTRLKNQLHALLAEHGVQPTKTDIFGPGGRRQLASLKLPPLTTRRIEAALRLIDELTLEIDGADSDLRKHFDKDPRVLRLLPIPGIGLTTAATIVAEVWDINRFRSPEHLCSWAGLTPREHSSAGHTRRGHISKQGSRWVRWVIVEAAMHGLRNAKLREWYLGIAVRRGEKIAAVAVGRRLLTLAFYALRDTHGCRAFPPSSSGRARSSFVMASAR
jgi:transposase